MPQRNWGLIDAFFLRRVDRRRQPCKNPGCLTITRDIYRRPDPLIYSQLYLGNQGLAVTWDNPDIHLEKESMYIPSSSLSPDTEYDIVARVWNGSNDAPAVNLPVKFSYLGFGISTSSTTIGLTHVDLPVKGAPGCPVLAHMGWRTPSVPGHYCIQVELIWPDDSNLSNNLGQENATVISLNSRHAEVVLPVSNSSMREIALHFETDTYVIPPVQTCDSNFRADSPAMSESEFRAHFQYITKHHKRGSYMLSDGWTAIIEPQSMHLAPGEEDTLKIDVTAPSGFSGKQPLNVNAFEGKQMAGGVTLYIQGSG
jgi:hypothetical protein